MLLVKEEQFLLSDEEYCLVLMILLLSLLYSHENRNEEIYRHYLVLDISGDMC